MASAASTRGVLDWPIGLESARETPDVADRIDLCQRDFEREELPEGYDFAFLGNIVHGIDPEGNRQLFGKLARATTERGTVVLLDQLADVSGSQFARAVAALVGFNLFLFSGGRAYPFADLRRWLQEAGFRHVEQKGCASRRASPWSSPASERECDSTPIRPASDTLPLRPQPPSRGCHRTRRR